MRLFGRVPGYATLAYDMLKGPLAIGAGMAVGAGDWFAYGAGLTAFIGHRLPFYLDFKGGRGFATANGLLVFALAHAVWRGYLPLLDGAVFVALFLILWWALNDRAMPDATLLPLAYLDIVRGAPLAFTVLTGLGVAYVWIYNLRRVRRERLWRVRRPIET